MKKTLLTLALISLGLAGCVVDPGRGYYGDRGYNERGWHNDNHAEFRATNGEHQNWSR